MTIFALSPVQVAIDTAIDKLQHGQIVVERQVIDLKEEAGRRGPKGVVLPGSTENITALEKLLPEVACMANTPGGGALLFGVDNNSHVIGTAIDSEWLRSNLYLKLQRRLTVDVRPVEILGERVLVIVIPEAIEAIRYQDKLHWRVSDACEAVDPTTWHERRFSLLQVDWSAQPSGLPSSSVRANALEIARDFLRSSEDPSANQLSDIPDAELLRRLNVVDGGGELTNAGALMFVGREHPSIDYVRREVEGGDSVARVRRTDRSLAEELQEVFITARAYNPVSHVEGGLVHGQVRQIPERALREAIVNGVAHREWTLTDSTVVEHVGGRLTVTSPGGFVLGVSADNLINHPSSSKNKSLVELFASLRIAEREGIGVDRMFGDMIRLGYSEPRIAEVPGPRVVTTLIANNPDPSWVAWLDSLSESEPRVKTDLRILMAISFATKNGWLDETVLAPYLQVSVVEARDVVRSIASITVGQQHLLVDVRGTPATAPLTKALSEHARSSLATLDERFNVRRIWPSRESVAESYAAHRGRISSTELADLIGAKPSNVGSILVSLSDQGVLAPSRAQRRGAGFHYVYGSQKS